jgi:hypothetical protein
MVNKEKNAIISKKWKAFSLLFFLIIIVYGNTFQASWHLDDYSNIVNNPVIKITDLYPQTLFKSFFAGREGDVYPQKSIYRPIACLSFALNWYVDQHNVFGYHLVNIVIHFLTAFFLYLTLLNLFNTPNLKEKYSGSEFFIALLAATLWAINPIQTQAVTYIVQRMAAMATMFYILALYFYTKARVENIKYKKNIFFFCCFLSFIFAIGSKENAATLPVALILLEIIFFQDLSQARTRKLFLGILVCAGLGVIVIGSLFFSTG